MFFTCLLMIGVEIVGMFGTCSLVIGVEVLGHIFHMFVGDWC